MSECSKKKWNLPSYIHHLNGEFVRCFLLLVIVWGSFSSAHTVDQVYLELEPSDDSLSAQFVLDAAYCLPEYRGDADKSAPNRDWLIALSATEHARLREEAENYVRESFTLMLDEQPLSYELAFHDYETEPPVFEESLLNKALMRVNVIASYVSSGGALQLKWEELNEASLIIQMPVQGAAEEEKYLQCYSGSTIEVGWSIEPLGASENQESLPQKTINSTGSSILTFVQIGFRHIIPMGLDHILFVVGLFLLAPRWKPLLQQSLIFTIAHSITLALSVLGWITFPSKWVEILIAGSIVYVGIENFIRTEVSRSRMIIVFCFGLLHGMGFATMLADYLRDTSLAVALLGFNVGVEIGQIVVLAGCFLVFTLLNPRIPHFRKVMSLAIVFIAIFWVVERMS